MHGQLQIAQHEIGLVSLKSFDRFFETGQRCAELLRLLAQFTQGLRHLFARSFARPGIFIRQIGSGLLQFLQLFAELIELVRIVPRFAQRVLQRLHLLLQFGRRRQPAGG